MCVCVWGGGGGVETYQISTFAMSIGERIDMCLISSVRVSPLIIF